MAIEILKVDGGAGTWALKAESAANRAMAAALKLIEDNPSWTLDRALSTVFAQTPHLYGEYIQEMALRQVGATKSKPVTKQLLEAGRGASHEAWLSKLAEAFRDEPALFEEYRREAYAGRAR